MLVSPIAITVYELQSLIIIAGVLGTEASQVLHIFALALPRNYTTSDPSSQQRSFHIGNDGIEGKL